MLRSLHLVLFFAALAFIVSITAVENGKSPVNPPIDIDPQPDDNVNDLEADATYWGYGRPYRYYGGWGGRGYGGWGGWSGYRGYWGRGWGGRGYGGWGLGYWG